MPLVAGADRDRDPLRGHERRPRARQLDLRQLARRRDAVLGPDALRRTAAAPRATSSPASPARARRENGISTSCGNQLLRQPAWARAPNGFAFPDGVDHVRQRRTRPTTRRRRDAERQRLLVGRVLRRQHRQLLVRQPRPDGTAGSVTGPGEAGRLPGMPPQVLPSRLRHERRQRRPRQARLPGRVRATAPTRTPARSTATGGRTPPQPGSARRAARQQRRDRRRGQLAREGSHEARRSASALAALTRSMSAGRRSRAGAGAPRGALARPRGCGAERQTGDEPRARRPRASARCGPARPPSSRAAGTGAAGPTPSATRRSRTSAASSPRRARDRRSPTLSDEAAYEIFEQACSTGDSDGLRLYKLYARAQAFAPPTGDAGN